MSKSLRRKAIKARRRYKFHPLPAATWGTEAQQRILEKMVEQVSNRERYAFLGLPIYRPRAAELGIARMLTPDMWLKTPSALEAKGLSNSPT